jgi:hypothetical protein
VQHAFIDESIRSSYVLAVTLCHGTDLVETRRQLRRCCLPGQRRVHFAGEQPRRRRQLLTSMASLEVRTSVYVARGHAPPTARALLLEAVVRALPDDTSRLTIESGDAQDARDRSTLSRTGASRWGLRYDHRRANEEPLLWIPDAVAWSYGRTTGGWRQRLEHLGLVDDVVIVA